jgi:ElaB/YqjD/DUF883 family membrane-anchored ribosome-binding protein
MDKETIIEPITKDKLMQDLRTLAGDAESMCKTLAGDWKERSRRVGSKALDSAKSSAQAVSRQTRACVSATNEAAKTHPYTSIGIALGLGVAFGLLLKVACSDTE